LINAQLEKELYGYIIGKADYLGCIVHAIGGIENHIHIVVSIPPKLSVADFVKTIKGSSAYHLNHLSSTSQIIFSWQHGYGVFTLRAKQLDFAKSYVNNQKEHHRNGSFLTALEKCSDEDD
jgi:putative transposase